MGAREVGGHVVALCSNHYPIACSLSVCLLYSQRVLTWTKPQAAETRLHLFIWMQSQTYGQHRLCKWIFIMCFHVCVRVRVFSSGKLVAFSLLHSGAAFFQLVLAEQAMTWKSPRYWDTLYQPRVIKDDILSLWVSVFILHLPSGWRVTAELLSNFALTHKVRTSEVLSPPSVSLSVDVRSRIPYAKV